MKIENFEDLECWKSARVLVKMVFEASISGPLARDFDTRSQIRRAALSAMNNIAEGFARFNSQESIYFYNIAQGSASEVYSMTYVLSDLNYLSNEEIGSLAQKAVEARNLTVGLIRYLRNRKKGRDQP